MTTPASYIRRIEALEAAVIGQRRSEEPGRGRFARDVGNRWAYLALTKRVGGTYPTSGNTFGLQFIDREFTPTEGTQAATDHTRSATSQAVGRTIDGSYIAEGQVVLAIPQPPPPGTTGKGKFHIVSLSGTVLLGKADGAMAVGNTGAPGTVSIWDPLFAGDLGFNITGCINWSVAIAAGDKVAVTWVMGTPIVSKLGC